MSREELSEKVLGILADLAPEADLDDVEPDEGLREALDLDSMDFLNFLIGIDAELGVDIPESDYPKLATLDSIYDYLEQARA